MRLHVPTLALAIALVGCSGDGRNESQLVDPGLGPLVLEGSIGKSILERGDTTVVSFRLRNVSQRSITLQFSSGCQVLPFIAQWPDANPVVYPDGGMWACTLALTERTLAPGEEHRIGVLIRAYPPPMPAVYSGVPLGPGDYAIFARVMSVRYPLQSQSIHVRVR